MGASDSILLRAAGGPLKGCFPLPASKSISNRALLIRALCEGEIELSNLSEARDTRLLRRALESGESVFQAGDGGTTFRFLLAYLAFAPGTHLLQAAPRIFERPHWELMTALRSLGALITCHSEDSLRIEGGRLSGGRLRISAEVSSQFISALMMIAPKLPGGLQIELEGEPLSAPYIEMTASVMAHFGVGLEWKDHVISIPHQSYLPRPLEIESDWSAAAFPCCMAVLRPGSELQLPGLKADSWQGDARIVQLLAEAGLEVTFGADDCRIQSSSATDWPDSLHLIDCPDLVQALLLTAALARKYLKISGWSSLRGKETDRVEALIESLSLIGQQLGVQDEFLVLEPASIELQSVEFDTYGDHRMAMALSMVSLMADDVIIRSPEVVDKSFPDYWRVLASLGWQID